jgi:hypothetical protein
MLLPRSVYTSQRIHSIRVPLPRGLLQQRHALLRSGLAPASNSPKSMGMPMSSSSWGWQPQTFVLVISKVTDHAQRISVCARRKACRCEVPTLHPPLPICRPRPGIPHHHPHHSPTCSPGSTARLGHLRQPSALQPRLRAHRSICGSSACVVQSPTGFASTFRFARAAAPLAAPAVPA